MSLKSHLSSFCLKNENALVSFRTFLRRLLYFISLIFVHFFQTIYYTIVGYPKKDLKGELALITGGGGGLGRLLALRLVRLGCKVILWDINQDGEYYITHTSSSKFFKYHLK